MARRGWRGWLGRRGSALIAVYWIIAILTFAAFTTGALLLGDLEHRADLRDQIAAEALSGRGLALAAHPEVEADDPVLWGEGFRGVIEREQSRLNLNRLLQVRDRLTLLTLFRRWGLERGEAEGLIDALTDWVDADDLLTGRGAEKLDYLRMGIEGAPGNAPFRTLAEVEQVRGMERLILARPDWEEAFTLWGNGRVDLADAEAEVIHAVTRCGMARAEAFVEDRRGRDGLENTEDDFDLPTAEAALALLGVARDDPAVGWLTVNAPLLRLRGIGEFGKVRVEQWVIVEERGPQVPLLDYGRGWN